MGRLGLWKLWGVLEGNGDLWETIEGLRAERGYMKL